MVDDIMNKCYHKIVRDATKCINDLFSIDYKLTSNIENNFMCWIGWLYQKFTSVDNDNENMKRLILVYLKFFYRAAINVLKEENVNITGLGNVIKYMFDSMERHELIPYVISRAKNLVITHIMLENKYQFL